VVNVEDVGAWEGQRAAEILVDVACKHGVTMSEMRSPLRSPKVAFARFEAMSRIQSEVGMKLSAIGFLLGGRDHSTVIHGIKVHRAKLAKEAAA
jgi:chromosomal replication initiator protein